MPKNVREEKTGVKTQKEFAEKVDVSPTTLSNWKKEPGFMNDVERLRRDHLDEKLSDVYQALIRRAKEGDVRAIKTALKQAGRYQEDLSEDSINENEAEQMSDRELARSFADIVSQSDEAQPKLQVAILEAMGAEVPDELKDNNEEEATEEEEPAEEKEDGLDQEEELEELLTQDMEEDDEDFAPEQEMETENTDLETTDEFTVPDHW